jgi:hypothetical protein
MDARAGGQIVKTGPGGERGWATVLGRFAALAARP